MSKYQDDNRDNEVTFVMKCNKCHGDKFEQHIKDYIFINSACGFHTQADQIVNFKCLECGYEFEECVPMDDLY